MRGGDEREHIHVSGDSSPICKRHLESMLKGWNPVFKTAGSAPDAAMILGLFSPKKILRLTLIVNYIELFIFILIFLCLIRMI
jgi:hypothetical protein